MHINDNEDPIRTQINVLNVFNSIRKIGTEKNKAKLNLEPNREINKAYKNVLVGWRTNARNMVIKIQIAVESDVEELYMMMSETIDFIYS